MINNQVWSSFYELAAAIMQSYSVTDKDKIRTQYLEQVAQYPLYEEWFNRIDPFVRHAELIIEYGSGPGILAGRINKQKEISGRTKHYAAVEPGEVFREMTKEQNPEAIIINGTAETYLVGDEDHSYDLAIATATYHHFSDKVKSLKNIYHNLYPGGMLVIADGFLPEYQFDNNFNPVDKTEFLNSVMKYVAAQIKFMPSPSEADIEDQMRTAMLDLFRIEELKVCISILEKQLSMAGFSEINIELMSRPDDKVNYENLGWYFVSAKRLLP